MKAPDRFPLAILPTPLVPAHRLSAALGREVWIKRDDLTGFAFGGNKVRALEVLIAEAIALRCDHVVGCGGPGSNFCTTLAAAASTAGLGCTLVLYGDSPAHPHVNVDVMRALGADIVFTGDADRAATAEHAERTAGELAASGHRPYVLPRGGATGLGATAYALAAEELDAQLAFAPASIVAPVGSAGTLAGLVVVCRACRLPGTLFGVAVSRPLDETRAEVVRLASEAADILAVDQVDADRFRLLDGLGSGFGAADEATRAAASLAMRTEGLAVDATYMARAIPVLHELDGPVVLWHTGGALGFVADAMVHT